MGAKVLEITVRYTDGNVSTFNSYDLERIEELNEVMSFIERARNVYNALKPIMAKEEVK